MSVHLKVTGGLIIINMYFFQKAGHTVRMLLKVARKTVPRLEWKRTPLVLRATAGLRLLAAEKARVLLEQVGRERNATHTELNATHTETRDTPSRPLSKSAVLYLRGRRGGATLSDTLSAKCSLLSGGGRGGRGRKSISPYCYRSGVSSVWKGIRS